jgi:hypothetical protein
MKLAHCGLMVLLAATCAGTPAASSAQQSQPARAQNGRSQTDPLAAAARKAREKQKDQPKAAKVWDNDNLPTAGDLNVIGPAAQGSSKEASSNSAEAEESSASDAESSEKPNKSDLEAQLKDAKENLKQLQKQLDFAQRKLALDEHDFYQNPNYASDDAGAQALKDEQNQVNSKKQAADAAQKQVDDLTAKVAAEGGGNDSGGENSSSTGSKQ